MIDYSKKLVDGEVLNRDRWANLLPVETQDVFASVIAPKPLASFQVPTPRASEEPPPPRIVDYSWRQPLERQVAEWLSLFVEEGQAVELRALSTWSSPME